MKLQYVIFLVLITCFAFLVGNVTAQKKPLTQQVNWKTVNLSRFSFDYPRSLKLSKEKGTDSPVWIFYDEQRKLYVEVGRYVGSVDELKQEKNYTEEKALINGVNSLISSFEFNKKEEGKYQFGSSLLMLKKNNAKLNLTMTFFFENKNDMEIAKAIFRSIKLN